MSQKGIAFADGGGTGIRDALISVSLVFQQGLCLGLVLGKVYTLSTAFVVLFPVRVLNDHNEGLRGLKGESCLPAVTAILKNLVVV